MTGPASRGYTFRTAAQWSACLFDRVDRQASGTQLTLQPIAPFDQVARLYATDGGHAPAVTRSGAILWHDDAGFLHRLSACAEEIETSPSPYAIAHAMRLVSASSGLWVAGESKTSLLRFEEETLARLTSVDVGDEVIDIASDGYDRIFVLIEHKGAVQAVRIDCSGRVASTVTFDGISRATAFVFLRQSKRFVVLVGEPYPRLYWFSEEGRTALLSIPVGATHACFQAHALGSDARNRVFLAGADDASFGGQALVLSFDGDGGPLGEVLLDARDPPVTGVTATRDSLLVTGPRGLLRHSVAPTVPDGTAEVRCALITPLLRSPNLGDRRRWLRIEATGDFPEGATVEISYGATNDPAIRDRLVLLARDGSLLMGHRLQKLRSEPGIWRPPIVFHGSGGPADDSPVPVALPLFDATEPYIWICIALSATAGGSLPSLTELSVLYRDETLMDNLPSIYRRAEGQAGSFLRSLVGVLETTTQGLDACIAALGAHVHPSTAPIPWLDFVARWLGVPWDDGLSPEQKRQLIAKAPELARGRGTRAGLETLLEALTGETPRRFRITDANADFGFATVGGEDCRGSTLPAILGGRTQWNSELDESAVLGRMRLPCNGVRDDTAERFAGHIRIEIAASDRERRAWELWLLALINEMVPITARVNLRWVNAQTLSGRRLDGSLILEGLPTAHLDTDAVTGVAHLPERRIRITPTGADIGTRLQ